MMLPDSSAVAEQPPLVQAAGHLTSLGHQAAASEAAGQCVGEKKARMMVPASSAVAEHAAEAAQQAAASEAAGQGGMMVDSRAGAEQRAASGYGPQHQVVSSAVEEQAVEAGQHVTSLGQQATGSCLSWSNSEGQQGTASEAKKARIMVPASNHHPEAEQPAAPGYEPEQQVTSLGHQAAWREENGSNAVPSRVGQEQPVEAVGYQVTSLGQQAAGSCLSWSTSEGQQGAGSEGQQGAGSGGPSSLLVAYAAADDIND